MLNEKRCCESRRAIHLGDGSAKRYHGCIADTFEDERQGYGVMRWTDGSTYMGTWHQGIQEGIGVMIFPDGTRRAGLFE